MKNVDHTGTRSVDPKIDGQRRYPLLQQDTLVYQKNFEDYMLQIVIFPLLFLIFRVIYAYLAKCIFKNNN